MSETQKHTPRIIISGGGTGGHIFPAVSIADAVKQLCPEAQILFVGAEGRMEMQRVPAAGYEIKGLPVAGFDRSRPWRNIGVLLKLRRSMQLAKKIVSEFQPDVAVGVGGYASGPTLKVAGKMGIPTLLQEQNSYAGVTNKLLAKQAQCICVAYDGMERFFPADRIMLTGNPVRRSLLNEAPTKADALRKLSLDEGKHTILIIGGSLGARTINESILGNLPLIRAQREVQFFWQTGKYYNASIAEELKGRGCPDNLHVADFISDMPAAYAAADLVVSRAGAGSISELCLLGKPAILVPSPNVAEDHQTKNAMALANKGAALCVADADARRTLLPLAINTVTDAQRLQGLTTEILKLAKPDAAEEIAREVLKLANK
ncbi:MAG: undecaprenyldiphospho-muramoylpentapeptide beta-N-acetylglucosaminyltransferase [Alloprevotella sp.]|nr:undecaprenyldiphospho-muramoylpentapeptide beta-N-acetylglucosaminyltransferase [Alloprevotella sp.]